MNLTWKIINLECIPNKGGLENIVTNINFECTGEYTDNGTTYVAVIEGNIGLGDVDVNNFTPFNNITKEQVMTWIENTRNYVATIHQLENLIKDQQKSQTILLTPPFGE